MKIKTLIILISILFIFSCRSKIIYENNNFKYFNGDYETTHQNNDKIFEDEKMIWNFSNGDITIYYKYREHSKYFFKGKYKINTSYKPFQIDISVIEFRNGKPKKEKKSKGILKYKKNILFLKIYPEGEKYPINFEVEPNAQLLKLLKAET